MQNGKNQFEGDEGELGLEKELKGLRPARLPVGLVSRVQRDLASDEDLAAAAPAASARRQWWWLAALPAAAAVLLVLRLASGEAAGDRTAGTPPTPLAAGETFRPVAAQNVLYAAEDEGIVTLEDGQPARRERLHFVDTVTWRHPRTNASLTWSVPREEVRIVPVNFH